jgi:hypothetical protein
MVTVEASALGEQQVVIRFLVVAVMAAGSVPADTSVAAAQSTAHCDYRDDFVSSIATDHLAHGRFAVHLTPTDKARTRGPRDYTSGSGAVTADLWHAVQGCVPDARGSAGESIHQQLECHVWFGSAAAATGPTYDLESWRRPLEHPGFASYLRTRCLNARPATDSRVHDGRDHWQRLWSAVGRVVARWSAAAAF